MNDDTSMNSPDLDPLHELASAHLDGASSADERAQVLASAQLTDIVASFADVRARLADVPAASTSARDTGIAAALEVFDELQGDHVDAGGAGQRSDRLVAAAPVVQLASRRRWPAIVMSAAAGLAVLGIAGVALLNGNSNDSASSATAAGKNRDMEATAEAASETMAAGDQPPSTIGNILSAGDVAVVIDTTEQLRQLPVPDDTFDSGGGGNDTTVAASESTAAQAPEAFPVSTQRAALACLSPTQVFLADILYQGELAIAARDTVTGVTVAITDDCTVLVAVGP